MTLLLSTAPGGERATEPLVAGVRELSYMIAQGHSKEVRWKLNQEIPKPEVCRGQEVLFPETGRDADRSPAPTGCLAASGAGQDRGPAALQPPG